MSSRPLLLASALLVASCAPSASKLSVDPSGATPGASAGLVPEAPPAVAPHSLVDLPPNPVPSLVAPFRRRTKPPRADSKVSDFLLATPSAVASASDEVSRGDSNAGDGVLPPDEASESAGSEASSVATLTDGSPCSADDDCASGHCLAVLRDEDGDGWGSAPIDDTRLCATPDGAPPVAHATFRSGDCCDSDPSSFPGASFSGRVNACGSWDIDCDGEIAFDHPGNCSVTEAGVPCGALCPSSSPASPLSTWTQLCK